MKKFYIHYPGSMHSLGPVEAKSITDARRIAAAMTDDGKLPRGTEVYEAEGTRSNPGKCQWCGEMQLRRHHDPRKAADKQKYCSACGMTYSPHATVKGSYAYLDKKTGRIVTGVRKNPQYAKDRFFKGDAIVQHYYKGQLVKESATIYSYESHTTLFDVTVTNGTKRVYYTKNMRASEYLPAHEQIMHHYGLKK